jgi:hypothetical protein
MVTRLPWIAHKLVSTAISNVKQGKRGVSHTLEQGDEVSFDGFLQGSDSRGLEAQIGLEILSNFTDKTLESTRTILDTVP